RDHGKDTGGEQGGKSRAEGDEKNGPQPPLLSAPGALWGSLGGGDVIGWSRVGQIEGQFHFDGGQASRIVAYPIFNKALDLGHGPRDHHFLFKNGLLHKAFYAAALDGVPHHGPTPLLSIAR